MKTMTTILMASGLVAVALCFIPPRCVQIPIGAWLRKTPVMPPSDGGGETLESFDPSKGSGRLVMADEPAITRPQWPKTYKAPDGVNTITESEDGTGSMTLAYVPRRITDSNGFSGHVITQAELDEVMTIIRDSANAHNFALDFYKTAIVAFRSTDEQAAIMTNIRTVTESGKRLLEFEAKWRKRIEEAKP